MSVINRTIKNGTNGMVTLYTVPSGKSAVITSLNHCNHSTSPQNVYTYIENSGLLASLNLFMGLGAGASIEIIGCGQKLVLNAGDTLRIYKQFNNTTDSIVTLMEID